MKQTKTYGHDKNLTAYGDKGEEIVVEFIKSINGTIIARNIDLNGQSLSTTRSHSADILVEKDFKKVIVEVKTQAPIKWNKNLTSLRSYLVEGYEDVYRTNGDFILAIVDYTTELIYKIKWSTFHNFKVFLDFYGRNDKPAFTEFKNIAIKYFKIPQHKQYQFTIDLHWIYLNFLNHSQYHKYKKTHDLIPVSLLTEWACLPPQSVAELQILAAQTGTYINGDMLNYKNR